MSSASAAKERFTGHGVSQILVGKETFSWLGLGRTGVRSLGGVLFRYNTGGNERVC